MGDAIRSRDPMAMRLHAHQQGQRIGGIVWPSDVDNLITQIDPSMKGTDRDVDACTTLDARTHDGWKEFFKSWGEFRDKRRGIFGAGGEFDQASAYRVQLGEWQEIIAKGCTLTGPKVSTEPEGALLASTIKWAAVAVIAASLVYGVRAVLK
jgi:hypothetical protein